MARAFCYEAVGLAGEDLLPARWRREVLGVLWPGFPPLCAAWFPRDLRLQLRRPPTLQPPVIDGVWSFPQATPSGIAATRRIRGGWYDLFVSHQVVFPLVPGLIAVQAAGLVALITGVILVARGPALTAVRSSHRPRAHPGQPGTASQPGTVQPGTVQPGTVEPGTVEPGAVEPGAVEPGAVQDGREW